ncbi:MAG: DUF58 domain-containing protein [Dehalococcoidia bacterium]
MNGQSEAPRAVPREVLQRIRRLQIRARKLVDNLFSGQYHAVFKGRGIEFSEVREYLPGDDIRIIDWNVSARTGQLYVKKYVEERELTVYIMVDVSASNDFGTTARSKRDLAAEVAAILALAAVDNKDRVGLVTFTDRIETYIEPGKGVQHVLRILRDLLYKQPAGRKTDIAAALSFLGRVAKRRSVVFLFSDFMDSGYEQDLLITARRHDIVAFSLTDPRELELPSIGMIELEDSESGGRVLVDTSDANTRRLFRRHVGEQIQRRRRTLAATHVDELPLRTDRPYVRPLLAYFRARAKGAGRMEREESVAV